jgi:hypothetical protein
VLHPKLTSQAIPPSFSIANIVNSRRIHGSPIPPLSAFKTLRLAFVLPQDQKGVEH